MMNVVRNLVLFGCLLIALGTAQGADSAGISIENPWARATPPGSKSAAIYLTIKNTSEIGVTVAGIATEVAHMAHIHQTRAQDGMMRMDSITTFSLKPGESRMFEPGGLHIMLMGLNQALVEGMTFNIEISFDQDISPITVPVRVGSIAQVSSP